jgi:hypothetical protein
MIRKALYKFHKWVWDYGRDDEIRLGNGPIAVSEEKISVDGLRFTVMPAIGGTLVQIRNYDSRKDRTDTSTYIITMDEDVATRIGQIVSLELLKVC